MHELSDSITIDLIFMGRDPAAMACDGSPEMEVFDANDNEYVTIADALKVLGYLFLGQGEIPAPSEGCGLDPTDARGGFDVVDPVYTVNAATLKVDGNDIEIGLEIECPSPIQAFSLAIAMPSGVQTAAPAFEPAPGVADQGAFNAQRVEGDTALITFAGRGDAIFGATSGPTLIGTLRFQRTGPGDASGFEWRREANMGPWLLRSTIVSNFEDHAPRFLADLEPIGGGSREGFVRGDMNGDGSVTMADADAFLAYFWDDAPAPSDCAGAATADAADANDNEYRTLADFMKLHAAAASGSALPGPSGSCGVDPDDSVQGFGVEDPSYTVTTGKVAVDPPTGLVPRIVQIPILVEAPGVVEAIQIIFRHDASLKPFGEDEGGAFISKYGAVRTKKLDDETLLIGLYNEDNGVDPFVGAAETLQQIGVVRFHLDPTPVFPPLQWVAERESGLLVYRASVVDESLNDHFPQLRVGAYKFVRGNSNSDADVDISDAINTLAYLFTGSSPKPECKGEADANNDDVIDISDSIYTLAFLFLANSQPIPAPYPQCGLDTGAVDPDDWCNTPELPNACAK